MVVEFNFNLFDKVQIVNSLIKGFVDAVMYGPDSKSQYRIVYWKDKTRETAWCYAHEIERIPAEATISPLQNEE